MLFSCFSKVSICDDRALLSLSEQSSIYWCFDCLVTFVWVSFGYDWLRFFEPWCVVHSSLKNTQPSLEPIQQKTDCPQENNLPLDTFI